MGGFFNYTIYGWCLVFYFSKFAPQSIIMQTNETMRPYFTHRSFFLGLIITSAVAAVVLFLLVFLVPAAGQLSGFVGLSMLFFFFLSVVFYLIGRVLAQSANRFSFTSFVSFSSFIKIAGTFMLLGIYRQMAKPENTWYVILFLLAYGIYTAFEIWFLTKLGHLKPNKF